MDGRTREAVEVDDATGRGVSHGRATVGLKPSVPCVFLSTRNSIERHRAQMAETSMTQEMEKKEVVEFVLGMVSILLSPYHGTHLYLLHRLLRQLLLFLHPILLMLHFLCHPD